jgi:hypothetical protein
MKRKSSPPALHPPIAPEDVRVSKDYSFDLRRVGLNQSYILLRYFLTKFLWRRESLSQWEWAAIWLLGEKVIHAEDSMFIAKYNLQWLAVKAIICRIKNQSYNDNSSDNFFRLLHRNSGVFLSPRAFLGRSYRKKDVLKSTNRRQKVKPRLQRFIGVGYRDKGSAKLSSEDGRPSIADTLGGYPDEVRKKFLESGLTVIINEHLHIIVKNTLVPFGPMRQVKVKIQGIQT